MQVRHPIDQEVQDLGTALDKDIPTCTETVDDNVRMCISVVYCLNDTIPETVDHGDGSTTNCTQVISGSRRRRQTQQTITHSGNNVPLIPLTQYCLAVKAEISTDVEGVSSYLSMIH